MPVAGESASQTCMLMKGSTTPSYPRSLKQTQSRPKKHELVLERGPLSLHALLDVIDSLTHGGDLLCLIV
jgi:hypothetical protein